MSAIAVRFRPRRVLDLPPEERPRERLFRHGPTALSSRELLALVLGSGSARASALDLAEGLLRDGLRGLASRSLAELRGESGLGEAQACRVLATLELGARVVAEAGPQAPSFRTPEESARYLLPRYSCRPTETFGLLCLDVRQRLKRETVISVGCLTSSLGASARGLSGGDRFARRGPRPVPQPPLRRSRAFGRGPARRPAVSPRRARSWASRCSTISSWARDAT